ncbi:hypothetical protein LDENG_00006530 [Lucifuga dentata]|nr:hypothetical protein LDENG_00006530 [Lucifuga dentata]
MYAYKCQNKVPVFVVSLLVSDILSFFGRPQALSRTVLSKDITSLLLRCHFQHHLHGVHSAGAAPPGGLPTVAWLLKQCAAICTGLCWSGLAVWAALFAVLALAMMQQYFCFTVAVLIPFPFLLFFAVDSWRALLCSRSTPPTPERRKTMLGLGAIWANYTFLYLPFIISILLESLSFKEEVRYLEVVSYLLLYLSPLVDPFFYIFMTKEVLQALPCCQKMRHTQDMRPTVDTVAETVET